MTPRGGWSMAIDQMSEPRQRTGWRAGSQDTAFRGISNLQEDSQFAEGRGYNMPIRKALLCRGSYPLCAPPITGDRFGTLFLMIIGSGGLKWVHKR